MTEKRAAPSSWFCFLALLAVLLTVEELCAALAYETLGEVMNAWLIGAIAVANLLPVVLFAARLRVAAVIAGLLIAAAVVPYQVVLATRLLALERESSQIVGWAYLQKERTGRFPTDLAGYRFSAPWLREHFTVLPAAVAAGGGTGFSLTFHVGNRGTSHSFGATAADGGHWSYYPD